jgi:hypothetical protein
MKKTSIGVALMLGLSGLYVQAQDMPRVAGYTLDATYVDQEPGIEALADVTFAEASFSSPQLAFYLHGELRVDEVKVDGKQVDVDHDLVFYPSDYSSVARRFRIELPGGKLPKKLSIRYSGKLNPSVARSPSNYMRVDREGVFLRSGLVSRVPGSETGHPHGGRRSHDSHASGVRCGPHWGAVG